MSRSCKSGMTEECSFLEEMTAEAMQGSELRAFVTKSIIGTTRKPRLRSEDARMVVYHLDGGAAILEEHAFVSHDPALPSKVLENKRCLYCTSNMFYKFAIVSRLRKSLMFLGGNFAW